MAHSDMSRKRGHKRALPDGVGIVNPLWADLHPPCDNTAAAICCRALMTSAGLSSGGGLSQQSKPQMTQKSLMGW